jgi:hypothetical protein
MPTLAMAWDADGFRSGTPVADVERELAAAGITGKPRVRDGDLRDAHFDPSMRRLAWVLQGSPVQLRTHF